VDVMKMLRRKKMQPPDIKRRKADVGDTVTFCLDDQGLSQYWAHNGHTGIVRAVELRPQLHRQGARAVYTIECECGLTLHPRANAFQVT
jgi:hypothetical protein